MFDASVNIKDDVLTLKNDVPLRIGFLPDMHCGASRGLSLPKYTWYDAGGLKQTESANKVQLSLYKLFKRNIKLFKSYGVQHVFVVGDAFSGENWIEKGAFLTVRNSLVSSH